MADIKILKGEMEEELSGLPTLSSTCCIYRAPERLRHGNEKSYIPKVVSIGPFHHGGEGLQAMEEHKKRYLDFLIKTRNLSLECCINVVKRKEGELRECYAEAMNFSSNEFVKIILVDATFIIAFLLKFEFDEVRDENHDRIFGKPWMIQNIWLDMLLLENQLPFFILRDLFVLLGPFTSEGEVVTISDLLFTFFKKRMHLEDDGTKWKTNCSDGTEHFVDLLRLLYLPLNKKGGGNGQGGGNAQGAGNGQRGGSAQGGRKRATPPTPSITELHLSGATFEVVSGENLLGLDFKNGVLKIPKLIISEETEILIRNILAFEQCHCKEYRINEYVFIMNRLVNSQNDVDIMVRHGIVENRLANNKRGSFLMNNLIDGVRVKFDELYFAGLCENLNKYYKKPWHKWMVDLRQKHFKTPWTIISLVAAATLLILTFIQTVYSTRSSKWT